MEAPVYNIKGERAGSVELPEKIFGAPWKADLVHQVATTMLSSRRAGTAHTKDRGDVSGGGKKPWQQKGTGRARHGSIRSPLWRGGGATFGPRTEKNYARKVNRKMSLAALVSVIAQKIRDEEVLFVERFSLPSARTKEAKAALSGLSSISGFEKLGHRGRLLLALDQKEASLERGFRNINRVSVGETRNLNVPDLLNHRYLVVVNPEFLVSDLTRRLERS